MREAGRTQSDSVIAFTPRSAHRATLQLARESRVTGRTESGAAVEKSFAARQETLDHVDGAISAILANLGMNPVAFNGIFYDRAHARAGAHVIEEQTREKRCAGSIRSITGYDDPHPRTFSISSKYKNPSPSPARAGSITQAPNIKTRYLFWRLKSLDIFLGVWCLGFWNLQL